MRRIWIGIGLTLAAVVCIFHVAHSRPNAAWEMMRIQAQAEGDVETLRRLKFVGTAGAVACSSYFTASLCVNGVIQISCCGEADAYEADDIYTDPQGVSWAVLTCNDPRNCQEVRNKVVRPPGQRFRIPPERVLLKDHPTNDTGHGWVWIQAGCTDPTGEPCVLCWATPGGF